MLARFLLFAGILLHAAGATAALDIQSWQTKNGARVLLVENDALPMVDIRVVFDAGSARDADLPGLALLTNSLLDEGADGLSATELAEVFESVGAQVSLESMRDMSSASLRSLSDSEYLDVALDAFSKVLSSPAFSEQAYERQMARFKVSVKSREQSPSDIAEEAFYEALYGDHPYASPVSGTLESLERITLDAVRAHYERYYVASNAVVAIVGDVTRTEAEVMTERLMGKLAEGQKAAPLPPVPALQASVTRYIDYPSTQSHIFIGQPGMSRGHEDYFDLYVANHPLGGSGFSSRLVNSIRVDRGLAYSVYSYFSPMREAGPFQMGMQTKNEQAKQAVELLNEELRRYIDEGPDAEELEASISNITGSFPLNLDSNSKMLGYIAMIGFYGLDIGYLDTFLDRIRAVTPASAKQAFASRIDADRLVTIVVGNRAQQLASGQGDEAQPAR